MEKVLLLDPWQDDLSPAALAGFGSVMTGSEFCQNELPSPEAAAALVKAAGGKFTLATPIMTDKALGGWERFVKTNRRRLGEVVVNDWGFAGFLKTQRGLKLSAGRLMMRELALLAPSWAKDFIRLHGILRGEADRPDLAEAARRLGLEVSWHGGYVFRAVTTYCPFEKHFKAACSFSCSGRTLKLSNRQLGHDLFLTGNAYFSKQSSKQVPAYARRQVVRPAGSGPA